MPMPMIEVRQRVWVPELPDIDLPSEDGEPLESHWHRLQINLLGDMLHQHWHGRTDFFAGGSMFVYYSLEQARTRAYKGPNFCVDPEDHSLRGWRLECTRYVPLAPDARGWL